MIRFAVGTRKGLFFVTKSGPDWRIEGPEFPGVQVPALLADPRSGQVLAAVEHGHFGTKMHRSADGGTTWTELPPPAWPEKPEDAPVIKDPWRGTEIPWSLEKIWCLEAGGPDEPGVLWCGTLPGGLFRSADHGDTWQLVRPLWDHPDRAKWAGGGYDVPGIHSVCVHPQDSRRVLAAISCGGVWRTEDGGRTWAQSAHGMRAEYAPPEQQYEPDGQDPHRMVQCQSHPDVLWVQHHNGIFRSADAGNSWQEIRPEGVSAFGFAVAVHPQDPDTAWFVPAQKDECRLPAGGEFLVSRTRDGGRTFQTLRTGLPAGKAWHLVYRHGLEVSPDGNVLAMASTTGGLWISEDGGEHWSEVSNDLPPVFCVRFVPPALG